MINSQPRELKGLGHDSISKGIGDQFSAGAVAGGSIGTVYQRGSVINSQHGLLGDHVDLSISKGIGDQFSAFSTHGKRHPQYIKGDR